MKEMKVKECAIRDRAGTRTTVELSQEVEIGTDEAGNYLFSGGLHLAVL